MAKLELDLVYYYVFDIGIDKKYEIHVEGDGNRWYSTELKKRPLLCVWKKHA